MSHKKDAKLIWVKIFVFHGSTQFILLSFITLDNAESKILSPVVDMVTETETQKYRQ